jgi:WD repeat-containing protein 35
LQKDGKEKLFHIDDIASSDSGKLDFRRTNSFVSLMFRKYIYIDTFRTTYDPICCLTASDRYLLVGRESGLVHRYLLPEIKMENKYTLKCRPQMLSLNCNSNRLAIVDVNGILTFMDFETKTGRSGATLRVFKSQK